VGGWVDNYYDIGPAAYLFVKIGDLSGTTYRDVILRPDNNVEFFSRTKNVTDIVYGGDVVAVNGPRYEQVASQIVRRLGHCDNRLGFSVDAWPTYFS
jgi:hypothetical protein